MKKNFGAIFCAVVAISLATKLYAGQPEQEEIARLRNEVAKLRNENAILKNQIKLVTEQLAMYEQKFAEIERRASEGALEGNMHTVQLNAEEFSTLADGAYPATILTTVSQVLTALGYTGSANPSSICGEDPGIPPYGSHALVPAKMRNPFDPSSPCVMTSKTYPPKWSPALVGIVWYVPIGTKGHTAQGYRIYGAGKTGLLDLVLSSGF